MSECIDHGQQGDRQGYANKKYDGVCQRVHRMAYCQHHGLHISEIFGKIVMHTCDNPRCINPDHLRLGTTEDNIKDKLNKGRQARLRGELCGMSKLTDQQVIQIREQRASGRMVKDIAESFGITAHHAWRILDGRRWGHLPNPWKEKMDRQPS